LSAGKEQDPPMPLNFHLESEGAPAPSHPGVRIYVDGTQHGIREDRDIELSHWNPSTTPEVYQADSSTEIALNFLALGTLPGDGLVINNHLDVDGILSAFVLLRPELALRHRERLVAVAETGDFWAWADAGSLGLYQALVEILEDGQAAGRDETAIHHDCFEALPDLLARDLSSHVPASLQATVQALDEGRLRRRVLHRRFAAFEIPRAHHQDDLAAALKVNDFNASLDDGSLLHFTARNRQDGCRVQLVSVEAARGWHHDLCYPGHMWALTVDRWRAPGFWEGETSNTWYYRYAPLEEALARLQAQEGGGGRWQSADELTPFASVLGRAFPVVASFLGDDDLPAASTLAPDTVARELLRAFTYDLTGRRG
jgi:hypothetical protein